MGKPSRSLKSNMVTLLVAALVLLVLVGAAGAAALIHAGNSFESMMKAERAESAWFLRTRNALFEAEKWATHYVYNGEESAAGKYLDIADDVDGYMSHMFARPGSEEARLTAEANEAWRRADAVAREALELPAGTGTTGPVDPLLEFHDPLDRAVAVLGRANVLTFDETRVNAAALSADSSRLVLILLAACLAGLVVVAYQGRRLLRSLGQPLRALERAAVEFGNDSLDHRTPVYRNDELGQVSKAFNEMAEKLQRSREAAAQSQKMEAMGQLAGGVAHDFNNILAVVLNYGRFLTEELPADDPRRADADEIIKAGERGARLIHQLLAFSRKESMQPQVLSLNERIADTSKMLSRVVPENIGLNVALDPRLWSTEIDPGHIDQVLMNLVVNAKDAMPTGGTLLIETSNVTVVDGDPAPAESMPAGDYVCLTVTDTGEGMDVDVQSHIFEPFYTTKEVGQGTGLGLASVYGIVRQARGQITVESAPGSGTTFRVFLPRVAAAEERPSEGEVAPSKAMDLQPMTAIVVEDEAAVRSLVVRMLARNGFATLAYADPAEALADLEGKSVAVDLLLTDVVMPKMSGKVLAERLGLPTIFMSGYTDDIVSGSKSGQGDVVLQKPFSEKDLLEAVRKRLGDTRAIAVRS